MKIFIAPGGSLAGSSRAGNRLYPWADQGELGVQGIHIQPLLLLTYYYVYVLSLFSALQPLPRGEAQVAVDLCPRTPREGPREALSRRNSAQTSPLLVDEAVEDFVRADQSPWKITTSRGSAPVALPKQRKSGQD